MTDEFLVLDDRQHVLLRAGMYLGSTTEEPISGIINYTYQTKRIVPALIKMVEEIIQNSLGEYIRTDGKYANKISITFSDTLDGTEISVTDNGRGIPVDDIQGKPKPVHAWTSLRAGSNFDDSKRIGPGANGVGSALVNIFSKNFCGNTATGKDRVVVTCSDNMLNITWKQSKTKDQGTTVTFIPDIARFNLQEFTQDHRDVIRDRVINLAIMYPEIQFSIDQEKIQFKNLKQIAKNFHPDSVSLEHGKVLLVFAPSGDQEEYRGHSYVNGIYIKNGGSHTDFILHRIIENLREHVKKKFKIDVLPNGIRQHLLFASWMGDLPAPSFDSQSKERITNSVSEVSAYLDGIDFDKISKQILNTPSIIDPMIAAILYKKEQADALALKKKQKATAKVRVVNHIAATDPNPENRMILLAEGLSAIGNLISVRDPKTVGGYPLRGKIMNVRDMKPVDIMKNKEISELLSIIGLKIGQPATELNYGKIVFFVDMDLDGTHILSLLLNLFSLWPELYEEKRLYRLISPLYYCTKGKITKIFYTEEEFANFNSKGYDISRFKGLGSMPLEVYSECVNNPVMEQILCNDDMDKLEMAFGGDASLRKTWMIG